MYIRFHLWCGSTSACFISIYSSFTLFHISNFSLHEIWRLALFLLWFENRAHSCLQCILWRNDTPSPTLKLLFWTYCIILQLHTKPVSPLIIRIKLLVVVYMSNPSCWSCPWFWVFLSEVLIAKKPNCPTSFGGHGQSSHQTPCLRSINSYWMTFSPSSLFLKQRKQNFPYQQKLKDYTDNGEMNWLEKSITGK